MNQTIPGDLLASLRALDIVKVVLPFSGGHDEGHYSTAYLTYRNGKTRELVENWKTSEETETEDDRLFQMLAKPIEDEWGGFAGDFSVSGNLTYEVQDGVFTLPCSYDDADESYIDSDVEI